MKTFDIIAMVVFGTFTITAAIASFFNTAHIFIMVASAVLTIIAYLDYKEEKREEDQEQENDGDREDKIA